MPHLSSASPDVLSIQGDDLCGIESLPGHIRQCDVAESVLLQRPSDIGLGISERARGSMAFRYSPNSASLTMFVFTAEHIHLIEIVMRFFLLYLTPLWCRTRAAQDALACIQGSSFHPENVPLMKPRRSASAACTEPFSSDAAPIL